MSEQNRKIALAAALALLVIVAGVLYMIGRRLGGVGMADIPGGGVEITLSDAGCGVRGDGATARGGVVTITAGGTYTLTGRLREGQLVVDAGDEAVTLLLAGAELRASANPVLVVKGTGLLTLTAQKGTENLLAAGADASRQGQGADGAVYGAGDLTLNGAGALSVSAARKHAVLAEGTLRVEGGRLTLEAESDALHGRNVALTGGAVVLTAGKDGAEAEESLLVSGGDFTVSAQGKGLKAGTALSVSGGSFALDCGDDAVHTNGALELSGGSFTVRCGDDAFHADAVLTLRGGRITVEECTEGLEAPQIDIEGGEVDITARNDGINACTSAAGLPSVLTLRGGRITLLCSGDGVDSNGDLLILGGELTVSAEDSDGNAALDYGAERGGVMRIDGGSVIACGFAKMAKGFDAASRQAWVLCRFPAVQPGGTPAALRSASGAELLRFTPGNAYNCVIFSSPALTRGESYLAEPGGISVNAPE